MILCLENNFLLKISGLNLKFYFHLIFNEYLIAIMVNMSFFNNDILLHMTIWFCILVLLARPPVLSVQ